jgi:hypothetical protein
MKKTAVLLLCVLAISATPAWTEDWHGDNNYPAQASAFTFANGVLSSNHPVRFGAWTVSFGAQALQTVYKQNAAATSWYHTANPYTLVCANAVLGQTSCQMWLVPANSTNNRDVCKMALHPDLGNVDTFVIPCPTGITFQH